MPKGESGGSRREGQTEGAMGTGGHVPRVSGSSRAAEDSGGGLANSRFILPCYSSTNTQVPLGLCVESQSLGSSQDHNSHICFPPCAPSSVLTCF